MTIKFVIKRRTDAPTAPPLDEQIFTGPILTIGSDTAATICLNNSSVASEQAVIVSEGAQLLLINRAAGTTLNDESLPREALRPLAEGDCLYIGDYAIKLTAEAADAPAHAAAHATAAVVQHEPASVPSRRRRSDFENPPETGAPVESNPGLQTMVANQSPEIAQTVETPHKSFAAILDSLRTEEDSFYFSIQGGLQTGASVRIEAAEMPMGWDETGQRLAFDHTRVFAPRAVVRKDWSGVVVQAHTAGLVSINDQPVESVQRLRNGDRLTVVPTGVTIEENIPALVFHEPASLVVLDSLLPQTLPPPIVSPPSPLDSTTPTGDRHALTVAATGTDIAKANKLKGRWRTERNYFGHFTLFEMMLVAIATIIAATIIFFLLEFSLS